MTITGSTGSNGAMSAESISVGSSGSGLAALFGGTKSAGAAPAAGSSGGGAPALFGGGSLSEDLASSAAIPAWRPPRNVQRVREQDHPTRSSMHHMTSSRRKLKPAVVGALLVVLAGLALAACGGSSTSSAASTQHQHERKLNAGDGHHRQSPGRRRKPLHGATRMSGEKRHHAAEIHARPATASGAGAARRPPLPKGVTQGAV